MPAVNEKLKYILLEAFFVVFGVVLAFGVNSYRENSIKIENSDLAIESINLEIEKNIQILSTAQNYHKYLIDTLRTFFRTTDIPNRDIFHSGYINRDFLRKDAYNVALSSGSFYKVDHNYLIKLSEIYSKIDEYNNQKGKAGSMIYELLFNEGMNSVPRKYKNLLSILYANLFMEMEILEIMTKFKDTKDENR